MAFVRTVKTKSGATAVQIVWSSAAGSRRIEHLGSAHDVGGVELLQAAGRQKIASVQAQLPFDVPQPVALMALPIVSSSMGRLLDALYGVYADLGLPEATGFDKVFADLVVARLIEPTSKQDAARVLREAGVRAMSYRTVKRRLPMFARPEFKAKVSDVLAADAKIGEASLLLYDVTTLWFETDTGDGFREPGFSKERRLEPQITVGLLADDKGFPLRVDAFEGNRGETTTMIPLIKAFLASHPVSGLTVAADAGMMSLANMVAIEQAGWGFIVAGRIPDVPYQASQWMKHHPGEAIPDGLTLTQPMPHTAGSTKPWTTYYQYRVGRARRTNAGIDQQIAKAVKAVEGKTPVKRNRFIKLSGATKTVNRELETKARALAGWKSYVTNLDMPADQIIDRYHQLWHVEHTFRMSKHDLRARPVYHHLRESIDAHLMIVTAALAVASRIETTTGWTINRLTKTLRRYRTVTINTGTQQVTAEDPLPDDLRDIISRLPRQH